MHGKDNICPVFCEPIDTIFIPALSAAPLFQTGRAPAAAVGYIFHCVA
jgi:hypothetical protein